MTSGARYTNMGEKAGRRSIPCNSAAVAHSSVPSSVMRSPLRRLTLRKNSSVKVVSLQEWQMTTNKRRAHTMLG